jgi:nicotinamidase-related amidase
MNSGNPMPFALLVIDVQQALCSGEHAVFEAGPVIARINAVMTQARQVGALVVVIQHEAKNSPLAFDTEGWQLARGINVQASDILLRKRAADSFHNTELQSILQAHHISTLAICGLQSEFCVDTTTRRALALGYPVILLADAHSTSDNSVLKAAQISAHHNQTLANISSFGPRVKVVPTAYFLKELHES